jgi:L-iditol 2-dehydrogenase
MKAAVFEGIERIAVRDFPEPVINENEILVRISTCAICGTDLRTFHHGHVLVTPPVILGHELAGTVVKVGSATTGFSTGDAVTIESSIPCLECPACARGFFNICDHLAGIGFQYGGGFAQYMKVPEQALKAKCLLKLPAGLSFEEACLAEPFACAINGQELSRIEPGDTVVIIGAGPLGCMHAELARINGARQVIMCERTGTRLGYVRRDIAADRFVDSSSEDLRTVVMDMTAGRGAEVVITAAPTATAQQAALSVAAPRARVCLFGGLPKTAPTVEFNANTIHYREMFVHGAYGSTARQMQDALALFASRRINAAKFVSARLPIHRFLEGLAVAEGRTGYRVVMTMD